MGGLLLRIAKSRSVIPTTTANAWKLLDCCNSSSAVNQTHKLPPFMVYQETVRRFGCQTLPVVAQSTKCPNFTNHGIMIPANKIKSLQLYSTQIAEAPRTQKSDRHVFLSFLPRCNFLKIYHSPGNMGSWLRWLCGVAVTFWSGLMNVKKLEENVEEAAEAVEDVAEVVEKVATLTEHLANTVAHDFAEGSRVSQAAQAVEHLSETLAHEAHATKVFADKISSKEKIVETSVESVVTAVEDLISSQAHPISTGKGGHEFSKSEP